MFLKEVHLTPNHWSFKLLKFTFPWIGRFYNFCPHFWLTILAIAIFPATLAGYTFYYLVMKVPLTIFTAMVEWVDKKLENRFLFLDPMQQEFGMYATYACDEDWDRYYAMRQDLPSCEFSKIKKYAAWFNQLPYAKQQELRIKYLAKKKEIEHKLEEIQEYYRAERVKKLQKEEEKRIKREANRKPKKERKNVLLPKMMFAGKVLGTTILIPTALIASYFIIMALGWMWYWIVFYAPLIPWTTVLLFLAGVAVGGGIIFLFAKFLIWLGPKISGVSFYSCERMRKIFRVIGIPFILIFKFLAWFVMGIVDAAKFLWVGFKTFKSENCPAIIWEEKKESKTESK